MLSKCQFCERQRVDFLGDSSWRSRKCWIFSGIIPNDEQCRPLWASATLAVFRNLATKRWIVFSSGTLFLPKSFLHCLCVIRTEWFDLNDFYPLLRSIASSWIHIGVKRISQACFLHHLKNMEKNCNAQLWDEKQNRALFLDHRVSHETSFFILEET